MVARDSGVGYDQLHRHRNLGRGTLENALLLEAYRMVGGTEAWLIVDDTALPKNGKRSVGVAPQYALARGQNANCQTLVSLTLAFGEVPVMVGLRLFLPESWTNDPARLSRAGVPEDHKVYRTKPEIALVAVMNRSKSWSKAGEAVGRRLAVATGFCATRSAARATRLNTIALSNGRDRSS